MERACTLYSIVCKVEPVLKELTCSSIFSPKKTLACQQQAVSVGHCPRAYLVVAGAERPSEGPGSWAARELWNARAELTLSFGHICLKRVYDSLYHYLSIYHFMRISSYEEKMRWKDEKRQWIRGGKRKEENIQVTWGYLSTGKM